MEVKNTINNETASEKLISNELLWRWLRGSTGNPCQVGFPGVEKNIFIYFIKEKKIS